MQGRGPSFAAADPGNSWAGNACIKPIWRQPEAACQRVDSANPEHRLDDAEVLAQIDPTHGLIVDHLIRRARHQNLAIMQDVRPINYFQRLANIVVGDQHTNSARLEILHKMPDFTDRDWVDPSKGLIKQKILRIGGKAARDFHAATFTPGKRQRRCVTKMGDGKLAEKLLETFAALPAVTDYDFKDCKDVAFDAQAAKDRHFLGQVAYAKPGAAIHRQGRDVLSVDKDLATLRHDQPRDRVEAGRLARSVRAEQGHHFSAPQVNTDISNDRSLLVAFSKIANLQTAGPFGDRQLWPTRCSH